MTSILHRLLELQKQLAPAGVTAPANRAALEVAPGEIPAPVLMHFLRLLAAGRKGVGLVRHGVCSACHLRVADATVANLRQSADLPLCENCGAYLLLDAEEKPAELVIELSAGPRRVRRKPRAALVAP